MTTDTAATVIIHAGDQAAAKAFLPDTEGCFNTPASADGKQPATHYFTSGPWANATLKALVNQTDFPREVDFGTDWARALADVGLQMIVPVEKA